MWWDNVGHLSFLAALLADGDDGVDATFERWDAFFIRTPFYKAKGPALALPLREVERYSSRLSSLTSKSVANALTRVPPTRIPSSNASLR